jgi:hypothetical protein
MAVKGGLSVAAQEAPTDEVTIEPVVVLLADSWDRYLSRIRMQSTEASDTSPRIS